MEKVYQEYMEAFSHIPKEDKQREIIHKTKDMIRVMTILCQRLGIESSLPSKLDFLNDSRDDDEVLNAMFAHLNCLEELLGNYLNHTL